MKTILITLFSVLAMQSAFAQNNPAVGRTLEAVMKDMGPKFKSLGQQIADASKNTDSTKLVRDLGALAQEGLALRPTKIATLPAAEQRPSELRYLRLMLDLQLLTIDAEEALLGHNQAAAIEAVKAMANLRGLGHDEFRE